MLKIFIAVTALSFSAFAADYSCKFQTEYEGEVLAAGELTAKDKGDGKYDLEVKYTAPEEGEDKLGEASEKNVEDFSEVCAFLEERSKEKFCDKAASATVITTPDEGGDSNDSFIGFVKDKDGKELKRFLKIGWLIDSCLPEDQDL